MSDDDLLKTSEVARMCNVTSYTVRRWITEGKLVSVTLNGQHRIKRSDLMAMLRGRAE